MKIVIIDYHLSNIFSVKHAFEKLGYNPLVSSDKKDLIEADAAVLPGVGAFGEAMNNLNKLDLVEPIKDFILDGKPFFGVCLGMQLLFEASEEFGDFVGLGLIKGVIRKFPVKKGLKIPQVCWKSIQTPPGVETWENTPFDGIKDGNYMYFVHSYYANPEYAENILSLSNYDSMSYCSAIINKKMVATQFHPEKSGELGLKIYHNWLANIQSSIVNDFKI